jgi:hypothetical protein
MTSEQTYDRRSCPTPWCSLRHRVHPLGECESAHFPTADHTIELSNDAPELEGLPDIIVRSRGRDGGYHLASRMSIDEARALADKLRFVADLAEPAG